MRVLSYLVIMLMFSTADSLAVNCQNNYSGDQSCAENSAGDCEDLGYTLEETPNCEHYIKCPFDTNYKRCVSVAENSEPEPTCQDLGFTQTDKTQWCKEIKECQQDGQTYTLCADACTYSSKEVCESFFGDATCEQKDGCYDFASCGTNTCKSTDQKCIKACSTSFKYALAPAFGTLSGESCEGVGTNRDGTCSQYAVYYKDYTCSVNYCKIDDGCAPICPEEYKYSYVANATLTGDSLYCAPATTAASPDQACTGALARRYTDFECDTGYTKTTFGSCLKINLPGGGGSSCKLDCDCSNCGGSSCTNDTKCSNGMSCLCNRPVIGGGELVVQPER